MIGLNVPLGSWVNYAELYTMAPSNLFTALANIYGYVQGVPSWWYYSQPISWLYQHASDLGQKSCRLHNKKSQLLKKKTEKKLKKWVQNISQEL